ncbi:MAG: TolC family protein [Bacteroidales bacterium]|nr:TolC family protein [Bacteroidales bacterium]
MTRTGVTLFIAMLLFSDFLRAQNPETINLQDCISHALKQNAEIQKASLHEQEAAWKTKEIGSSALPQLNINGMFNYYIDLPTQILPGELMGMPGQDLEVQFGKKYNTNANLEVSQMIFSKPWITGLQTAKTAEDLYALVTLKTEEDIIYNVSELYYNILINQEQLSTIDYNMKRLESLSGIVELQYEGKIVKKTDWNRVKVNLINLNTQKMMLQDGINKQIYFLKVLIGMPSDTAIYVCDKSFIKSEPVVTSSTAPFNIEEKTEIQLIKKQKEMNQLELQSIKAGYYPALYGFGQFGLQAQRNEFDFFDSDQSWYNMNLVGLKLEIPVFDGFKKSTKAKQSKLRMNMLEIDYQNTTNFLTTEYKIALESLSTSFQSFHAQKQNKLLALEVYDQTELQYKEGIAALTDLLNAEAALMDAQTLFNQTILKYKVAELDLKKAKGELRDNN